MKTSDYLNQLIKDKKKLVENLKALNVEATEEETFTTLVDKISQIETEPHYTVVSYDETTENLECPICGTTTTRLHQCSDISADDEGNIVKKCINKGCDYSYVQSHICTLENPGTKEFVENDPNVCYTITQKCLDPDCDKEVVTKYEHNWRTRPNGNTVCRECHLEIAATEEVA